MSDPGGETAQPPPEDDLYVLLNSARDATTEQLRQAFRKLSQLYHPDKHVDETAKAAANERFTRIKEAYEVLSEERLRRVYDEFGLSAARAAASPAMELVPYADLAARFRQEAEPRGSGQPSGAPRDAYFTVVNSAETHVDGTGLVVALEDGVLPTGAPLLAIMRVSLASVATAYVAQSLTVTAQYSTTSVRRTSSSGAGAGDIALSARYQTCPYSHAELSTHLPLEDPTRATFGAKAARTLDRLSQMSIETIYDPADASATTSISLGRVFSDRHYSSISWATGAVPGVAFTWRRDAYDEYSPDEPSRKKGENDDDEEDTEIEELDTVDVASDQVNPVRVAGLRNRLPSVRDLQKYVKHFVDPVGMRCTLRMGAMTSVSVVVRRPIGSLVPLFEPSEPAGPGGPSVKVRASAGVFGWEVEAGGSERYVMNDTAWGLAVSCGSRGVVWKFKVSRGGHQFVLPIVLVSATSDAKTATAAAIASSLVVTAIQSLIVQPLLKYQQSAEKAEMREQRAEYLEKCKRDAEAAAELLARQVATCRQNEENVVIDGREKAGLIIERAIYGVKEVTRAVRLSEPSFLGRELEAEVIEVGDCVQALVENSHVQVVSSTKSTLMGFWDPSAFGEKEELALRIWYKFKGELHDCVLDDMEPLELPLSNHKVDAWS